MVKILHFADAHIDMANYGRHDPESGLPLRVIDFLKSLDTIVDTAIQEKVDLVLFAGDAYKDRNPAPTFQREWGKRMMRLSKANIPTLLLVGNHDLSPGWGRAHAIEEFTTLEVPHIHVLDKPCFLTPDQIEGVPLQVIALPWISRSGLVANLGLSAAEPGKLYENLEKRLLELVDLWLENADLALPVLLAAHFSVQGAKFGVERTVMLGDDLVLPSHLVRDPRLDYAALGHIHKPQNLNENAHPPAIYPGSIERVDFGEVKDDKYFVIAHIERGETKVEWRQLKDVRPFVDRYVTLESPDNIGECLRNALPHPDQLKGAIVRLSLEYPREWEPSIDESALKEHRAAAFEFHLHRHPLMQTRIRIPEDHSVGSLTSMELLDLYWREKHIEEAETQELNRLAVEIVEDNQNGRDSL